MKRNENGDFCVLYVEPTDEKSTLIQTISERKKPVIILLAEQARVFQSSEDFEELKRATQQQDVPIFFVFTNNGDLAELAARHGFPVYASMEMIVEAVASGQLSRHRSWIRMITTLESVKPVASAEAKKTTSTLETNKPAAEAKKATSVLEAEKPAASVKGTATLLATAQPAVAAEAKKTVSILEVEKPAAEAKKTTSMLGAVQAAVVAEAKNASSLLEAEKPTVEMKKMTSLLEAEKPAVEAKKTTSLLEAEKPATVAEAKKTSSLLETEQPAVTAEAKKTSSLLEAAKPATVAEAKKTAILLGTEQPAVTAQAKKTAVLSMVEDDIAEIPTRPFCPVLPSVHIRPAVSEPPFVPSSELPFGDLPPVIELPQKGQPQSNRFVKTFVVLAIVALALVSIGSVLISYRPLPTTNAASIGTPSIVGRVAFLSSEQISENSNQGLNDQVLVDLHNVPNPAQQRSYYAWLLGDKNQNDMKTVFLGNLPVDHGNARLLYPGDQQHTNLLAFGSRLLVTEEDATIMPVGPSPDFNTWRYYGEIPQAAVNTPDATDNLSFLAHLRHLLASDPTLDEMGLHGGLNTWLYRNTSQVVELMSSTRQPWEEKKDVGFVRRQTMRTLVYLDGTSFAAQDLSANTALISNERLASVGLLQVNGPNQDPPSYLTHFVHHLNGLLQTTGATPETRKTIATIAVALNDIQFSLMRLRQDALTLINMNDDQLRQPATLTLINDMISNARNALLGQVDPADGQMHQGVDWIHTQMQQLATFNVAPFVAGQQSFQWVDGTKSRAAQFNLVRGFYE